MVHWNGKYAVKEIKWKLMMFLNEQKVIKTMKYYYDYDIYVCGEAKLECKTNTNF